MLNKFSWIFLLLLSFTAFGQNNDVEIDVNTLPGNTPEEKYAGMFSLLSGFETGVFLQKALPIVPYPRYNGALSSDTCSQSFWALLYKQVYEASPQSFQNQLPTLAYLQDEVSANIVTKQKIDIGFIFMDYDQIREQADSEPANFTFENGKLKPAATQSNPYTKQVLFAVGPVASFKCKLNAVFRINSAWKISNRPDITNAILEIDFDDNLGYRTVNLDTDIPVNYRAGKKTWKIRCTTANGMFYANSSIIVEDDAAGKFYKDNTPDLSDWTDPGYDGGDAKIFLRDGHNGKMHKPVIFVEGFDLTEVFSNDDNSIYRLLNAGDDAKQDGLLHLLNKNGYDVVLLNLKQGLRSTIQDYSQVIRRLLLWANTNKEGCWAVAYMDTII